MTETQQAALQSLAGIVLSLQQCALIDEMIADGNHVAIAGLLGDAREAVQRPLRVDEMFDILFASGDYAVLKQAQLAGDPRAVLAFDTLTDARTLGPGMVNLALPATVALLDALQAGDDVLLSDAGRQALAAAALVRPEPIHHAAVTAALGA